MIENPDKREILACLTIDDPLLRPRYGFIDYEKLLKEMKIHHFFTEIAFIPWNYKRSDPRTVQLLVDHSDYYAICVHGYNHNGNEFGGVNFRGLRTLACGALWRMEQHKRLTGLPYDPVMIFPQGLFSSVAMKALKDQRYFAACNSTIRATDPVVPPVMESQHPATLAYHNFPLFLRRPMKDRAFFMDDIAAGRPIIIEGHHNAFKNGYKAITDLVDWINSLGNIRWTSLLNIAEYYLRAKAPVPEKVDDLPPSSLQWDAKTAFRRVLSEARDNYLEKSPFLFKVYKAIKVSIQERS